MAEIHFVVAYDTERDLWFIDHDLEAYFPDGNIWDNALAESTGYGWTVAFDDAELDRTVNETFQILKDCLITLPTLPQLAAVRDKVWSE